MAANRKYAAGKQLEVVPTDGMHSPIQSGDAVVLGQMPGVALGPTLTDGTTPVDFAGVYALAVTANNGAINPGDIVYYHVATHTIDNTAASGVRYGYALQAVASTATATINVKLGY